MDKETARKRYPKRSNRYERSYNEEAGDPPQGESETAAKKKKEDDDRPTCFFCKAKFEEEDQLDAHLRFQCGRSLGNFFKLDARFCNSCKLSYKNYSAAEFMAHVGTCVFTMQKDRVLSRKSASSSSPPSDDRGGGDEGSSKRMTKSDSSVVNMSQTKGTSERPETAQGNGIGFGITSSQETPLGVPGGVIQGQQQNPCSSTSGSATSSPSFSFRPFNFRDYEYIGGTNQRGVTIAFLKRRPINDTSSASGSSASSQGTAHNDTAK